MRNHSTKQADLPDMLAAREARARRQQRLLARHHKPLISFTLNIPGPQKNSPLIARGFDLALERLESRLKRHGVPVIARELTRAFTGNEALFALDAEALDLKRLTCRLEEADGLGRLMDIDVLDQEGAKIPRESAGCRPRPCLLCDKPAMLCAPGRAHPAEELFFKAEEIITAALRAAHARLIGKLAQESLVTEALVTPKPGLVDQANSGAHRDMSLASLMTSACALRGYFEDAALTGMRLSGDAPSCVMASLRPLGLEAEAAMYEATGGVNAHKGAIYALGILCAAAGRLAEKQSAVNAGSLLDTAALIAADEALALPALAEKEGGTAGLRLYAASGVTGARGEAAAGFPAVRHTALPRLRQYLAEGHSANDALAFTLIHLMAEVQDTNLMKRAGAGRYPEVLQEIRALLASPPLRLSAIRRLDEQFIAENLSPGGSADLLGAAWLIRLLEQQRFM